MTKDEAMKLALEALDGLYLPGELERVNKAISALREAQPELTTQPAQQHPAAVPSRVTDALHSLDDFVARCNGNDRGSDASVNTIRSFLQSLAKQPVQQEPVALVDEFGIQECVDIGQYSLQVIFKDRPSADRFKAAHNKKVNT